MVFLELRQPQKARRTHLSSGQSQGGLALLLCLSVLTLIFAVSHRNSLNRKFQPELRVLHPEEKEELIFDLEQITQRTPRWQSSEKVVADFFNSGSNLLLDRGGRNNGPLVRLKNRTVIFSARFFEEDSVVQEVALRELLRTFLPDPGESDSLSDLGVRPE